MPETYCMWLALALLTVGVDGSSIDKRQVFNNQRVQIQNHETSLSECRRHIQLLTGQAKQETANYWQSGPIGGFGNWDWRHFDDRRRRGSVAVRRAFYNNYWNNNNNHGQLQNKLQTLVQELNHCTTQLQSIRLAQNEMRNKEQVANSLLQQVHVGAIHLRTCVNMGGRTGADLDALFRYIANGGFIHSHNTPSSNGDPPPRPTYYRPWGAFIGEFDDKRRAKLQPATVDWTQIAAQRQQWLTLVQGAVIWCWVSLGRLPDGTLSMVTTATTQKPQHPPFPNFPQPPPATTRTSTTPAPLPTTKLKTDRTTLKPTTTTKPTPPPTTTTRSTTTTKPTSPPTTTTHSTTTTTKLTPPLTYSTTTTTKSTTPLQTTMTVLPSTISTIFSTTTTGPGLTTTFAPLITTTPC